MFDSSWNEMVDRYEPNIKVDPDALRRTGGSENNRNEFTSFTSALRRTGGSENSVKITPDNVIALRRTGGSERFARRVCTWF